MEDILRAAKNFLKRMADADRKAADLRAEAGEIEEELSFPLSAGVGKMEPGRAKGRHGSRVETEAIKRERLRERAGALLHEAGLFCSLLLAKTPKNPKEGVTRTRRVQAGRLSKGAES